jgi:hypothetical protein
MMLVFVAPPSRRRAQLVASAPKTDEVPVIDAAPDGRSSAAALAVNPLALMSESGHRRLPL